MFVKHHTVDVVILQTHVVLLSQTDLEKQMMLPEYM